MLKKMAETLVSGALGMLALYVVGRLSYQAGQEMAREEARYQQMQRARLEGAQAPDTPDTPRTAEEKEQPLPIAPRRRGGLLNMALGAGRHGGMLKQLLREPEAHRLEACVDGDALQIRVYPKDARVKQASL